LAVRGTGLDATNLTRWGASTSESVFLLWRRDLRSFRSIVNSYDGFRAVDVTKLVRWRLGINERLAASRWLSLRNPYQINADKKENDEQCTSKLVRSDGSEQPFIHL
jgi:hypothetical protein